MKSKHIIWTDLIDYEDWRTDMEAEYPDEDERYRIDRAYEINDEYLDDERVNLNIKLNRDIIVIADLGLWNGRKTGYKEIRSRNIADCLYSRDDYMTWYVDERGDLRGDGVHHDGTNHYLYRVYKDNVTARQIDNFHEKLYTGTATEKDIERVTRRLGDEIGAVYGWTFENKATKTSKVTAAPEIDASDAA